MDLLFRCSSGDDETNDDDAFVNVGIVSMIFDDDLGALNNKKKFWEMEKLRNGLLALRKKIGY